MPSYGYTNIGTVGNSVNLIASDFEDVRWKPGGITIDWTKVTAVSVDTVLTGGTTILAGQKYIPVGTVMVKVTATGLYGPADTSASDGRQTLDATSRGKAFLLNEDVSQNSPLGLVQGNASDHPGVFDTGTIWKALLKVGDTNQPTLNNFLLAFPGIAFAEM